MADALGMIETRSFPATVEAADAMVKAANINVLEVITFGSFGRIWLGGEERDIDVAYRAAEAAIEAVTGRTEGK